MFLHFQLGTTSFGRLRLLKSLIDSGQVLLAGNRQLKIYGTLDCRSGKRMKTRNRVFFKDESEAIQAGFRPCGHCLPHLYRAWKDRNNQVE